MHCCDINATRSGWKRWPLLCWAPFPHPTPHSPPPSQLHLLLLILLLPCPVSCSSSRTTVQSIFSSIISTDQFNGKIGVRQAFTHSFVKLEKRGTWPRSWGQKRRPEENPNQRKGPLGDLGPLKVNPNQHNAILVSCWGGAIFSNQIFEEGSPSSALEDTPHVGLAVPQPLSRSEHS